MQVDATHIKTNQTKDMEINFIQLAHLTPEEHLKLAKEGRCFHCRNTGHISRNCPKNENPQTGNQPQRPWPPRNNQSQNQGWQPNNNTQNPPAYTCATVTKPPSAPEKQKQTLGDLVTQIKNLLVDESDKLLESMIGGQGEQDEDGQGSTLSGF